MTEQETNEGIIRLRVRDVTQLFNSFDPDPFIDRDLDNDAIDFIVSWAREIPARTPLELVVEITEPRRTIDYHEVIAGAICNNFGQMAELAKHDFRELMRRGRVSLAIGLAVLAFAVGLGDLVARRVDSAFGDVVRESVLIGGWVAMWRPIEIFLYDWWPLLRRRRDYERLRDMPVTVRLLAEPAIHGAANVPG